MASVSSDPLLSKLCESCQEVTLESLGYYSTRSDDNPHQGHTFKHKLGDLAARSARCQLCNILEKRCREIAKQFQLNPRSSINLGHVGSALPQNRREEVDRLKIIRISLYYEYPRNDSDFSFGDFVQNVGKSLGVCMRGGQGKIEHIQQLPKDEEGRFIISSDSPLSYGRLRSWLTECEQYHPGCRQMLSGEHIGVHEDTTLPSRVIDLGVSSGSVPYILESSNMKGKYCALSYCWGSMAGSTEFSLRLSTLEQFKQCLPIDPLPQTIKDAISITRHFNIRYLWVDSLCILQDDLNDWNQEASQMQYTYELAHFTIAASGAENSSEGCFMARAEHQARFSPQLLFFLPWNFEKPSWDANRFLPEIEDTRWSRRGWVFQERIFSRRMMHYTRHGVVWECRHSCQAETGWKGDNTPTNGLKYNEFYYTKSTVGNWKMLCVNNIRADAPPSLKKRIARALPLLENTMHAKAFPHIRYDAWRQIVTQYTSLELSFNKDKLPAISGIAQTIQAITKDKYYAGVWQGDIARELFWWPSSHSERGNDDRAQINGPTWSWAAHNGPVFFTSGYQWPRRNHNASVLGPQNALFVPFPRLHSLRAIQMSTMLFPGRRFEESLKKDDRITGFAFSFFVNYINSTSSRGPIVPEIKDWCGRPDCYILHTDAMGGMPPIGNGGPDRVGLVLMNNGDPPQMQFQCVVLGVGARGYAMEPYCLLYLLIVAETNTPGVYERLGVGFALMHGDELRTRERGQIRGFRRRRERSPPFDATVPRSLVTLV